MRPPSLLVVTTVQERTSISCTFPLYPDRATFQEVVPLAPTLVKRASIGGFETARAVSDVSGKDIFTQPPLAPRKLRERFGHTGVERNLLLAAVAALRAPFKVLMCRTRSLS